VQTSAVPAGRTLSFFSTADSKVSFIESAAASVLIQLSVFVAADSVKLFPVAVTIDPSNFLLMILDIMINGKRPERARRLIVEEERGLSFGMNWVADGEMAYDDIPLNNDVCCRNYQFTRGPQSFYIL
jgi:hypothetical protein